MELDICRSVKVTVLTYHLFATRTEVRDDAIYILTVLQIVRMHVAVLYIERERMPCSGKVYACASRRFITYYFQNFIPRPGGDFEQV